MAFNYSDLDQIRKTNPSWRLMMADNATLIISFFDRAFRIKNIRQISEDELIRDLEDYLYELRKTVGEDAFPRPASEYLDDWTVPGREWLRKFYIQDSNIAYYDLTPASELVLQWVDGFFDNGFVGTESRLKTSVDLLRQIVHGAEEDKDVRLQELKNEREKLDKKIQAVEAGKLDMLDDRQVRERFLQFQRTAKELLGDFRKVEYRFRGLDKNVREEIATWNGSKGELLEKFFLYQNTITDSEEGQSFNAFWDFLMTSSSQEELSDLLDRVFKIKALNGLLEDKRLRRIHFDWIKAGEQTQHTVARLSHQLRRYIDDRAYWENRRISELLDEIEKQAIEIKEDYPSQAFMHIDDYKVLLNLPLEHPLFSLPVTTKLISNIEITSDENVNTDKLYSVFYVDEARLLKNIAKSLEKSSQVTLQQILDENPLQKGLAELVTYVNLAEKDSRTYVDKNVYDTVIWSTAEQKIKKATYPRIVFCKKVKN